MTRDNARIILSRIARAMQPREGSASRAFESVLKFRGAKARTIAQKSAPLIINLYEYLVILIRYVITRRDSAADLPGRIAAKKPCASGKCGGSVRTPSGVISAPEIIYR